MPIGFETLGGGVYDLSGQYAQVFNPYAAKTQMQIAVNNATLANLTQKYNPPASYNPNGQLFIRVPSSPPNYNPQVGPVQGFDPAAWINKLYTDVAGFADKKTPDKSAFEAVGIGAGALQLAVALGIGYVLYKAVKK